MLTHPIFLTADRFQQVLLQQYPSLVHLIGVHVSNTCLSLSDSWAGLDRFYSEPLGTLREFSVKLMKKGWTCGADIYFVYLKSCVFFYKRRTAERDVPHEWLEKPITVISWHDNSDTMWLRQDPQMHPGWFGQTEDSVPGGGGVWIGEILQNPHWVPLVYSVWSKVSSGTAFPFSTIQCLYVTQTFPMHMNAPLTVWK